MTLEELRDRIDVLDRQLVELLSERARAALMIGHLKAATSLPVYEPAREKIDLRQRARGQQGPAARHRADAYLRAHHRRDAGAATERVGLGETRPGEASGLQTRFGPATGTRRRPRQGKKNDCRHAGEGHRRADRCRHRRHGGGRSWSPSNYRREADHPGGRRPNRRPRPHQVRNPAGVLHVHRISSPYKLAGRSFRPEGTVVEFRNGVKVGGQQCAS